MARLIFYDAKHEYELDGEVVPSVSEIARFASREVYGDVVQYSLDHACERGTAVHRATELLDKYGECEVGEEIEPYVEAYVRFRKDYGIDAFEAVEKAYASAEFRFAGTIDRVVELGGKRTIIDLKTSSAIKNALAEIQLNAYKILWEENCPDKPVEALYLLQLRKDGSYKLLPYPVDPTLFRACFTLHNALAKKKRNANKKEEQNNDGKRTNGNQGIR